MLILKILILFFVETKLTSKINELFQNSRLEKLLTDMGKFLAFYSQYIIHHTTKTMCIFKGYLMLKQVLPLARMLL